MTLGDNVYERGTAGEFADCYHPSWGRRSVPASSATFTDSGSAACH